MNIIKKILKAQPTLHTQENYLNFILFNSFTYSGHLNCIIGDIYFHLLNVITTFKFDYTILKCSESYSLCILVRIEIGFI